MWKYKQPILSGFRHTDEVIVQDNANVGLKKSWFPPSETKGVNVSKVYFGGPNLDKITKFKFSRRIQLWNSFPASINIKSNSLLNIEIFISHYKLEIEIYAAQCKTRTTFSRKSARLRDAIDWIKSGKKHKVEFLQKNLNSDSGSNLSCWVHIFFWNDGQLLLHCVSQ